MKSLKILVVLMGSLGFLGEVMAKNYTKPSPEEIKSKLTELQYEVTQKEGTERAFQNEYWDNKREGLYVDVVTGEPLFSSKDKYDSGTGWPSFTKPLSPDAVETRKDRRLFFQVRTEVRSKVGGSHLGHVFDDGPKPTGQRWCMNSAALRFVPVENLEKEGYGEYLVLFKQPSTEGKKTGEVNMTTKTQKATLAAGCFWGVEHILKGLKGVKGTTVGYIGGRVDNPNYKIVSTGSSGHAEAVEVEFDPSIISYKEILSYFWRLHDPTQLNRQGVDEGPQYRSAIFYHSEDQKKIAEESKAEFDKSGVFKTKAVTEIVPAGKFYSAEEYHQDYFERNGGHVCHVLRPK